MFLSFSPSVSLFLSLCLYQSNSLTHSLIHSLSIQHYHLNLKSLTDSLLHGYQANSPELALAHMSHFDIAYDVKRNIDAATAR
jgi:hypothetical protein